MAKTPTQSEDKSQKQVHLAQGSTLFGEEGMDATTMILGMSWDTHKVVCRRRDLVSPLVKGSRHPMDR